MNIAKNNNGQLQLHLSIAKFIIALVLTGVLSAGGVLWANTIATVRQEGVNQSVERRVSTLETQWEKMSIKLDEITRTQVIILERLPPRP